MKQRIIVYLPKGGPHPLKEKSGRISDDLDERMRKRFGEDFDLDSELLEPDERALLDKISPHHYAGLAGCILVTAFGKNNTGSAHLFPGQLNKGHLEDILRHIGKKPEIAINVPPASEKPGNDVEEHTEEALQEILDYFASKSRSQAREHRPPQI